MANHHFKPTAYYTSFGSHPAALRIADGDTVTTSTLDAWGGGPAGERTGPGPNPLTGPFFMEDAEPGDALKVRLDHLNPNRETGWSHSTLAAHVVDPEYCSRPPQPGRMEWRIHFERRMAELSAPPESLPGFSVPLNPMLGCIGVAPLNGQIISSVTSGPYGGNMDYRGLVAGTVVYLPVFVPGALLFLGDGHAAQGDGETLGSGIETSFDVRFTVFLSKGKKIQWPRGENADFIFTLGNARPLEQALQHATTEMLTWLKEDYGLEVNAASVLLGMCTHYDLGNIVDPAYTMVCRLPKNMVPQDDCRRHED